VLRSLRFALPLLLVLGSLVGCSSDSQVIARVGDHPIRAEDLLATARALAARGVLPPDSAKQKVLEALIQRELLVRAAQRAGLHRDTVFLDLRDRTEKALLRERMIGELVAGPIEVSEGEIAKLHGWRNQESRARVIFTPSREAAEAALLQIRGGIDFALVANRFNPEGFTPPGGDIGFVTAGFLQPPIDDVVRTAVPGRLYGPIAAPPQGWFVVRVEERRPRRSEPLEAERSTLTEVIRQRKQVVSVLRSVDRLKTAHGVRVLPGAPQELMTRVLQSLADSAGRLPELSEADRARPLAIYQGGSYTLGDAYGELRSATVNRPNFQSSSSVEYWIESRAIDRVLLREAGARAYAAEPSLQRALRERLNDYLLESYYNREVVTLNATDAEAEALYVRDPSSGAVLQSVRALAVTLPDSASATQLAAIAPQAAGLREAVATAGIPVPVQAETIAYPTTHPLWSALEQVFQMTPPGGYAGPFRLPVGWLVVQVVDKTQGAGSFAALPPQMQESFRHLATEALRGGRLRALTDSLRREYPVTIDRKRLERLEFPTPVMLGGGGFPGM
jgi:peptidyl-prolyl cis-trans isomerase C